MVFRTLTIRAEMTTIVITTASTMKMLSHLASLACALSLAASSTLAGFFTSSGGFCDGKMVSINCSVCTAGQRVASLMSKFNHLSTCDANLEEVRVVRVVPLVYPAQISLERFAKYLQVLR